MFNNEFAFPKELVINNDDLTGLDEVIKASKNADVVLLAFGEHALQSGEGRSQSHISLPGVQQEVMEAIYKTNKNVVLLLHNGRPLAIDWANENIPGILDVWQLGTQSGNAIAQVLFGDYNPSGKLPMTFPKSVGQIPVYYNHKSTGRPNLPAPDEVFWSHYTDIANEPLYPFGYGLSYTKFAYSNLQVEQISDNEFSVSFALKNTGNYEGKEVAQLYIQDVVASVTRPVKELKGFELVNLKPNESKTVSIKLSPEELGFYDNQGEFVVEPGDFKVFVGGSSNTILEGSFQLE